MSRIDFRKSSQRVGNVYVWKVGKDTYDVGINGTSKHFREYSKEATKNRVNDLLNS